MHGISHPLRLHLLRIVLLILLAVAPLLPREAAAQPAPAVCTIGASVESLYDLDMARDTLGATLWLWTLCPSSLPRPVLETIEFPSAGSLSREQIEVTDLGDGRVYASQRLQGTFRFNWRMGAYPFDRQRVVIPFDETEFGADRLVFEADTDASFLSQTVQSALTEWNVSDFALTTGLGEAESSYGVPLAETREFAAAEIAFTLDRTSLGPFLKLTSGVVAAAFIAFFSFFYDPNDKGTFGGRLGLLVGVLFAVLVNMRAADTVLGDVGDMTLVTQIHLLTLAYVVLLALLALRDRLHADAGHELPHPHWRRLSLIGGSYLLFVALLMLRAVLA